jgi:hypothetical protein
MRFRGNVSRDQSMAVNENDIFSMINSKTLQCGLSKGAAVIRSMKLYDK